MHFVLDPIFSAHRTNVFLRRVTLLLFVVEFNDNTDTLGEKEFVRDLAQHQKETIENPFSHNSDKTTQKD